MEGLLETILDLRSRVSAIRGMAGHAAAEIDGATDSEQLRSSLDFVLHSCEEMQRALGECLALEKVDGAALHLQPVDLQALAHEVVTSLAPRAERSQVTLAAMLDVTSPAVTADVEGLRDALGHLVDAALRRSAAGGRVSITTRGDEDGVTVQLRRAGPCGQWSEEGLGMAIARRWLSLHGTDLAWESGAEAEIASFFLPASQSA